ncbi:hypothetical protein G5C60_14855, partial [Streptomyces sp. HC44]
APDPVEPRRILLTGATGFLGAHLLFDLLRRSDAHVVYLVRATDQEAAERKLADALTGYFMPWSDALSPDDFPPGVETLEDLLAMRKRSWAALQATGIDGEAGYVSLDPDEAEAELRRLFDGQSFGVVLIGGGIKAAHGAGHRRDLAQQRQQLRDVACGFLWSATPRAGAPPVSTARPAVGTADAPPPRRRRSARANGSNTSPRSPPVRTGLQASRTGQ